MICTKCVCDSSIPDINLVFDEKGICNNCRSFEKFVNESDCFNEEKNIVQLAQTIQEIKDAGKGKPYDSILGISGGVDSTYLALLAKQHGLRPLVVHFDNGWDSELAVQNIQNIVTTLGFHLQTYVINWDEFKDLHLAYLKASVIDIEVPTDHFIYATLYEVAYKNKIKYILDGNNVATEFSNVSWKWAFSKTDLVNLRNIHKKFGTRPLKKYPKLGAYQRYFYDEVARIKSVRLNNYVPYIKKDIMQLIEKELGWKDPGGKHYESIFTRFYQGYILPKKFGVDKRVAHLSNLIWSCQLTRNEAVEILKEPTYPVGLQMEDKAYIIKKFSLTEPEFEKIMAAPIVKHEVYGTEKDEASKFRLVIKLVHPFVRVLRKIGVIG